MKEQMRLGREEAEKKELNKLTKHGFLEHKLHHGQEANLQLPQDLSGLVHHANKRDDGAQHSHGGDHFVFVILSLRLCNHAKERVSLEK